MSVSDLGSTVSALVGGNVVGKFSTGGRRIDIRMRLLANQRTRPEDVSNIEETTGGLAVAMLIGIAVAYMVLASQFNSFLHPVTVLTILPLALSGAVLGLVGAGKTLNLFSMIGLLLFMGIVKKNSILLVEYANHIREHKKKDAMTAASRASRRAAAPSTHSHDDDRDDDGSRPARPRPRPRHRDAQPDGRGGARRVGGLDDPQPRRGPRVLCRVRSHPQQGLSSNAGSRNHTYAYAKKSSRDNLCDVGNVGARS